MQRRRRKGQTDTSSKYIIKNFQNSYGVRTNQISVYKKCLLTLRIEFKSNLNKVPGEL